MIGVDKRAKYNRLCYCERDDLIIMYYIKLDYWAGSPLSLETRVVRFCECVLDKVYSLCEVLSLHGIQWVKCFGYWMLRFSSWWVASKLTCEIANTGRKDSHKQIMLPSLSLALYWVEVHSGSANVTTYLDILWQYPHTTIEVKLAKADSLGLSNI